MEVKRMNSMENEHQIKLETYKQKYKDLEEKEMKFLENEFNKNKMRLEEEYKEKLISYEFKLRQKNEKIQKDVNKIDCFFFRKSNLLLKVVFCIF